MRLTNACRQFNFSSRDEIFIKKNLSKNLKILIILHRMNTQLVNNLLILILHFIRAASQLHFLNLKVTNVPTPRSKNIITFRRKAFACNDKVIPAETFRTLKLSPSKRIY